MGWNEGGFGGVRIWYFRSYILEGFKTSSCLPDRFSQFHILKITFSASVPSSAPCEQIYFDILRTPSSRSCFKVVVQRVLPRLWYSGLCSDWYLWCVIKGVVLKLQYSLIFFSELYLWCVILLRSFIERLLFPESWIKTYEMVRCLPNESARRLQLIYNANIEWNAYNLISGWQKLCEGTMGLHWKKLDLDEQFQPKHMFLLQY